MILNVFFAAISTLIQTVFGVLPSLPDMPAGITDALDNIPSIVRFGTRFLSYYIGGTYLLILIPLLIALANFNWIYHLAIWIIKKLPIGVK